MGRAKEIVVKVIPAKVANEFVKKHHYSGKVAHIVNPKIVQKLLFVFFEPFFSAHFKSGLINCDFMRYDCFLEILRYLKVVYIIGVEKCLNREF